MTDLVVISLEQWDGVWRRNQHLIWRLLQADPALRILFVEPPADPLHDVRSRRMPTFGHRPSDRELPGKLWTMRPLKPLPRRFDRGADARITRGIVRSARTLGMTDPILWVNDPGGAEVSRLTGWGTLYDMTDDWLAADRPEAELTRVRAQEEYLLTHAEQVVACSPELQRRKSGQRPRDRDPVVLVPNAVDADAYRELRARPSDLPPGMSVIYVGTLHGDRLDVELCASLAEQLRGTASLVLVGPDALAESARARLRNAGVFLLGARRHGDVIAYLQHADVLVVPHVVSSFTDSLDPIKLYEYQAAGRPIVSTAVAGFRDAEDPRIALAAPAEFGRAVHAALADPRSSEVDERRTLPDWRERAQAMRAVADRILQP